MVSLSSDIGSLRDDGDLQNEVMSTPRATSDSLFNGTYDSETDSDFENEVYTNDAQHQWDENMKQIETAVFFVLCPVIGKLVGRKTAQSLWARFVTWRWQSAQKAGII